MVSGASSAPRAMSAWDRVALIAVLTVAFAATIYGGQQLTGWLMRVVKIPTSSIVSYDEIVAEMLSRTALIAVWSLPLLVSPHLRDIGSFRLPRTWTPLLLFPVLALNVYFFGRFPVPMADGRKRRRASRRAPPAPSTIGPWQAGRGHSSSEWTRMKRGRTGCPPSLSTPRRSRRRSWQGSSPTHSCAENPLVVSRSLTRASELEFRFR